MKLEIELTEKEVLEVFQEYIDRTIPGAQLKIDAMSVFPYSDTRYAVLELSQEAPVRYSVDIASAPETLVSISGCTGIDESTDIPF